MTVSLKNTTRRSHAFAMTCLISGIALTTTPVHAVADPGAAHPAETPMTETVETVETAAAAPPADRIGLDEVIQRASTHSFQVLQAAVELERVQGAGQEARAELLPGAELRVGGDNLDGATIGSFGDLRDDLSFSRYSTSVALTLNTNPGAALAGLAAAGDRTDAAQSALDNARRTAILEAAVAYQRLLLYSAIEQIAEESSVDASRFVQIATARADAGLISGADVARAQVEASRNLAALPSAHAARRNAGIHLALLLDMDPEQELHVADTPEGPGLWSKLDVEHSNEGDVNKRPDLVAAQQRASAAARTVSAAWWDILGPDLDLGARERFIGLETDDLEDTSVVWGFLAFTFDFGELARG